MKKISYKDTKKFLSEIQMKILEKKIKIGLSSIDHICRRVNSQKEYNDYYELFSSDGALLKTNIINGREISTFKMPKSIGGIVADIDVIELPAPKKGSPYPTGREHVECVITQSFTEFIENHSHIEFDTSSMQKKENPEIKISLDINLAIKFHHESLESLLQKQLLEEESSKTNPLSLL